MSRDVFSGALAGLSESFQKHNESLLSQEIARRQSLATFWQKQSEDPNVRPEAREIATQKLLGIVQTPYEKKLSKDLESMDDFLSVTPRVGESLRAPAPQEPPKPLEGTGMVPAL